MRWRSGGAMKRTLEVGPGTASDGICRPADIWGECGEVETLDGEAANKPTYTHDLRQKLPDELRGRYDYVLASHVLEHIDRGHLGQAIDNLVDALQPGGQLCILVPSLEWAAERIVRGEDNMAVQGMLWGGQRDGNAWDVHYCGFTLKALVMICRMRGLDIVMAGQMPFAITSNGKELAAMSNYVLAKKVIT